MFSGSTRRRGRGSERRSGRAEEGSVFVVPQLVKCSLTGLIHNPVQQHHRSHGIRHLQRELTVRARERIRQIKRVPRWVRLVRAAYHNYGGKHLMLILILVLYNFLGATVFFLCEASANEDMEDDFWLNITTERDTFISKHIMPSLFNNSRYLFFTDSSQHTEILHKLGAHLGQYEKQLGITYTDQKIRWDFWTAMLYAQTICTTIGYGHLYPSTPAGRVCTMLYAIVGIPLVFSVLHDLGKLMTKGLKYPWYLLKCGTRRAFRYCTKQSHEEIRRLDEEDRKDIDVFDLPIPVAVVLVIAWIFVCSATFMLWEQDWDYFQAFYFFFISLSTVGLGDITPSKPMGLLMGFGYIIVGLSLVSMCINLIQLKIERTYEQGVATNREDSSIDYEHSHSHRASQRSHRGVTLGVLTSAHSSSYSLNAPPGTRPQQQRPANVEQSRSTARSTQTLLSFPSPRRNTKFGLLMHRNRVLPSGNSMDDVMRMVDTDEGDLLIMAALSHDVSVERDLTNAEPCCESTHPPESAATQDDEDTSEALRPLRALPTPPAPVASLLQCGLLLHNIAASQAVFSFSSGHNASDNPASGVRTSSSEDEYTISDDRQDEASADATTPTDSQPAGIAHRIAQRDLYDIEEIEEFEDRILLQQPLSLQHANEVHFRSRLSLIPEHGKDGSQVSRSCSHSESARTPDSPESVLCGGGVTGESSSLVTTSGGQFPSTSASASATTRTSNDSSQPTTCVPRLSACASESDSLLVTPRRPASAVLTDTVVADSTTRVAPGRSGRSRLPHSRSEPVDFDYREIDEQSVLIDESQDDESTSQQQPASLSGLVGLLRRARRAKVNAVSSSHM